jgi:hypothetical protein
MVIFMMLKLEMTWTAVSSRDSCRFGSRDGGQPETTVMFPADVHHGMEAGAGSHRQAPREAGRLPQSGDGFGPEQRRQISSRRAEDFEEGNKSNGERRRQFENPASDARPSH